MRREGARAMIPYDRAIIERLDGDTPKEKFDKLVLIQKLLHKIAYPARGTEDEQITIQDIADEIIKLNLIDWHKEY
jgi:hypothetical protein